jgi:hypothetical protein
MRTLWHRYQKEAYLGIALASIVLPWLVSFSVYLAMR